MAELEGDTVLGRYVLGERLAAGSLGTVVAATDPRTGRAVAVKFFDGANDNYAAWVDEMRLALRLVHPHIVPCLDVGHDAGFGLSVLVFPRALGGSLLRRALASGRRFTEEEVRGLLLAMAAALDHAHAHGVVHRDVKPENILALTQVGEPPWALTDFGAGRFLARGAALRSLAGSLPYMAPEVALGVADAASDQYSLGVVALELLLGARPELAGRSAFRLQPGCASGLMAVVARLLDPDPGRRFPGCEALVLALAGLPGAFDVGRTADGAMHLLAGGEVLRVCRDVPAGAGVSGDAGASLIHEADEATAIVACDRRIVGLDGRATTLLAVEDDLLGFVASRRRGAAWLLRGERLVVSDLAGGQAGARVPLPDEWRPLLGPDAPLTGVTLDHEAALLGLHGAHTLLLVVRVGAGVRVQVLRAPAPVYALVRRDEAALIVCGDERGAALLQLVADGLTVIDHGPLPVDCYAVAPGPGPARLRRLIVEDAEDGEAGDG